MMLLLVILILFFIFIDTEVNEPSERLWIVFTLTMFSVFITLISLLLMSDCTNRQDVVNITNTECNTSDTCVTWKGNRVVIHENLPLGEVRLITNTDICFSNKYTKPTYVYTTYRQKYKSMIVQLWPSHTHKQQLYLPESFRR